MLLRWRKGSSAVSSGRSPPPAKTTAPEGPPAQPLPPAAKGSPASGTARQVPQGVAAVKKLLWLCFEDQTPGFSPSVCLIQFAAAVVAFQLADNFLSVRVIQSLTRALEVHDPEAFEVWFPFLSIVAAKAAADFLMHSRSWRIFKVQRRNLAFRLCRALLGPEEPDAHVLYRLHFVEATSTPEHQITEDAHNFGLFFWHSLLPALRTLVSLVLSSREILLTNSTFFFQSLAMLPVTAAVNLLLAKALVNDLVVKQEEIYATLRAFLGRIKSHVESVALFRGGASELRRYESAHGVLVRTKARLSAASAAIALANEVLSWVLVLVPAWDLVRAVIDGRATVSLAITTYYLMEGVKGGVRSLTAMPTALVQAGVPAHRILQLLSDADALRAQAARRRQAAETEVGRHAVLAVERRRAAGEDRGPVLELHDVALWTPKAPGRAEQALIEGLSFGLRAGESLLVAGETGAGKTALLAAVQGLWDSGRGRVSRCGDAAVICVPQQPYTFQGSLREQLLYPSPDREDVSDAELRRVLGQVNLLRDLRAYRLDDVCPWGDILSLGQQQRVGIARALLAEGVCLVLLDDCTCALDLRNERHVYAAVSERAPCYVSAGHRPALRGYHTHILDLQPGAPGAWRLAVPVPGGAGPDGARKGAALGVQATLRGAAAEAAGLPSSAGPGAEACAAAADEPAAETAAGRGRVALPQVNFMAPVRCALEVAWPILSDPSFRPRLLGQGAVNLVLLVASGWLDFRAGSFVGSAVETLRAGNLDGLVASVRRNFWMIPAKVLMTWGTTWASASFTAFGTEALRLGIARRYLGCGSTALYLLHTTGSSESPRDQISDVCGYDCDLLGLNGLFLVQVSLRMFFGLAMTSIGLFQQVPRLSGCLLVVCLVFGLAVYHLLVTTAIRSFVVFLERYTALRSSIAHAYMHAHSLALLRGSPAELLRVSAISDASVEAGFRYLFRIALLKIIDYILDFLLELLGYVCTAPAVLEGSMTFGESQALVGRVKGATGLVRQFLSMMCEAAPIFSVSHRLQAFVQALAEAEAAAGSGGEGIALLEPAAPFALELREVTLRTPREALGLGSLTLLHGASTALPVGCSLLVAGESGLGKSSLLRALAGLWSNGEGTVCRPRDGSAFFVSQRPYLCLGSLREQLLYPDAGAAGGPPDAELREALHAVGLDHLLLDPGLEEEVKKEPGEEEQEGETLPDPDAGLKSVQSAMHWTGHLSQGEVQRVSFARVLLRKGLRLVLLDEGTAAMDMTHEADMYSLLQGHVASYVSVAHRPQLRRFHSHVLSLVRADGAATTRFLTMADYEGALSEGSPAA